MLGVGDRLPAMELPDQNGRTAALAELGGAAGLVLFVYSRDNTSGCGAEAAEFQELLPRFRALGYELAGVSKDGVASHAKFAAKLGLAYVLLADPETTLLRALGAWVSKTSRGKTTMAAQRSTFVAGPDGVLRAVWPKVKAKGHAQAVLELLGG